MAAVNPATLFIEAATTLTLEGTEAARRGGLTLKAYAEAHGQEIGELYGTIAGLRRRGLILRSKRTPQNKFVAVRARKPMERSPDHLTVNNKPRSFGWKVGSISFSPTLTVSNCPFARTIDPRWVRAEKAIFAVNPPVWPDFQTISSPESDDMNQPSPESVPEMPVGLRV